MAANLYQKHWDYYAATVKQNDDRWPGDEWGTPDSWQRVFERLFLDFGASKWKAAVEIGPGSGKYTLKLLESSEAHVIAADISPNYQEHFCNRLRERNLLSRTTPILLNTNSSATLRKAIEDKGWVGCLDACYSIDAMVHVDLQYLIAYIVTSAACLKVGGKLILTLANCCNERGFEKLIRDTKRMFDQMDSHTAKFEWMSPDQVQFILSQLGFELDLLDTRGRDMWVVATLRTPLTDPKVLACIY